MQLEKIEIIKSDERGIIYDCGKSNFIARKKGSISANHAHPDHEIIYLVTGEVEVTIADETQVIAAPIKFSIGSNVYHKLIALTDIELIIERNQE